MEIYLSPDSALSQKVALEKKGTPIEAASWGEDGLTVLVVGAGTAGLAAADELKRKGCIVKVNNIDITLESLDKVTLSLPHPSFVRHSHGAKVTPWPNSTIHFR